MAVEKKPRAAPLLAPDRVPRPATARGPANPRSLEAIITAAKKRYAATLAYLAAK